jgi:hypothetical protein
MGGKTYPSSASNGGTNWGGAVLIGGIGFCRWAVCSSGIVGSLDCIARAALRGLRAGAGLVVILLKEHIGVVV